MSEAAWTAVRKVLTHPTFWPVAILAGAFGYEETLRMLDGDLPPEAQRLLDQGQFNRADLPSRATTTAAMWGAIMHGDFRPRDGKATVENKAKKAGLTKAQGLEAHQVMESFVPLKLMQDMP